MRGPDGAGELTDDEVRDIARRLMQAVHEPPDAPAAAVLMPPPGGGSPADEDRIDRALVALGYIPPDALGDRGDADD